MVGQLDELFAGMRSGAVESKINSPAEVDATEGETERFWVRYTTRRSPVTS
jgi:hypothetical protein